jgi:hypothetical protein
MRRGFRLLGIAVLALRLASECSAADLETARQIIVSGRTTDQSPSISLTLQPPDGLPVPSWTTNTDAAGAFSAPVKLFPGLNTIRIDSGSASEERHVDVQVDAPAIRVELTWAGHRQDYDLYVNNVYYGETDVDGGVLDRDTIDQQEPATENITFARAAAGLYKVYVNYYLSHTPSASDPVPTTVKIYVNDDEVFTETRTITEPEEGIDDGRGTWSVCTLVVHSGEESGGYQVAENGLRDLLPQKTLLHRISPRTGFSVESLSGPTAGDIFLPVGRSAQVTAKGTINTGTSNEQSDVDLIEKFESSDESVVVVDDLGVVTAVAAPGDATITAGDAGPQVVVHTVGAKFEAQPGKINFGFDPRVRDHPDGTLTDAPWASVVKGSTRDVVSLVIPNWADKMKLFVVPDRGQPVEVNVAPKTGFVNGANNLTLSSPSGGTDSVTTATVEVHVLDAQGADTGEIVAKLHVMALPPRTLSVGIYRVGDDRPRDDGQPRMLPPTTPTNTDIKNELNDLFTQAGISFTISGDSRPVPNVPFDDNNYGAVDSIELDAIDDAVNGFAAPRCIVLAEQSGTTSGGGPFPRGMGLNDAASKGCIVFVANSGVYAPTIASHEIGHLLGLSFYGPPSGPGVSAAQAKHDNGSFPAGTASLMQNANSTGRWLGHDDWRVANEFMKDHLQ